MNKKHKYKFGDIVKVVANKTNHSFKLGKKIRIINLICEDYENMKEYYYLAEYLNYQDKWFVNDNEIERI